MRVVRKNAEQTLFNLIQDLKENVPLHRCAVFHLSQISLIPEDAHNRIIHAASKIIEHEDLGFYICDDGDLFMMSRHITTKYFITILSLPTLSPWLVSQTGKPANLFELGVNGDKIQMVLKKKIEIIRLREEAIKQKKLQAQIEYIKRKEEEALNQDVHLDMVGTLPNRRDHRGEPCILIVEDEAFTRRLVEKSLSGKFKVCFAENASQAVQLYIRHAPDVLFLDIGLPDADGLHLLDKMMEIDKDAYVVMLSGNGHKENVVQAIEKGAKGFVGKPFTKGKLESYVHKSPYIKKKLEEVQEWN